MIKKTSETTPVAATVVNQKNNSTTDAYSCGYVNALHDYNYYYSNSSTGLTITPTKDCLCEVIASFSTWGYGGGTVTAAITINNSPTTYYNYEAQGVNGDSVARDITARALFKLTAGTTYSISAGVSNSGGQKTRMLIAKTIPINE